MERQQYLAYIPQGGAILWEPVRTSWHWLRALSLLLSGQLSSYLDASFFVSWYQCSGHQHFSHNLPLNYNIKLIPNPQKLAIKINNHSHLMTESVLVLCKCNCPCLPICTLSFLLPWFVRLLPWQLKWVVALVGLKWSLCWGQLLVFSSHCNC